MNQRACHYFRTASDVMPLLEGGAEDFFELTNKFRTCIFVAGDNFADPEGFVDSLAYDSVLKTHEVFTQYLTYQMTSPPRIITRPLIENRVQSYWIHDIDVWVGLPPAAENKVMGFGPHVFCYPNLEFLKSLR